MHSRYNAHNSMGLLRATFTLVLATCLPALAFAQTDAAPRSPWADAADKFAAKIAGMVGPGTVSAQWRNISSMTQREVGEVRRIVAADWKRDGITSQNTESAATHLKITLSENVAELLWIAEIRQGTQTKIAMMPVPRMRKISTQENAMPLTLRAQTLLTSDSPLLAAITNDSPSGRQLWILAAKDQVATLTGYSTDSGWSRNELISVPINHSQPFPRDIRGILQSAGGSIKAYLPGVTCTVVQQPPYSVQCLETDDAWPIGIGQAAFFAKQRNYFSGLLSPAIGKHGEVAPFYSSAALPRSSQPLWVFTRTDAKLQLVDGVNSFAVSPPQSFGLGSQIAAFTSECDNSTHLLAEIAGENPQYESLRIFDIPDRQLVASSAPLSLDGLVTSLHSSGAGNEVVAIVHNLTTRDYEAVLITATCSR